MSGSLPSHYDGMVRRTVYFAERYGSCYSRSTTIWVQNCWDSFYVYYFQSYAIGCDYRYCGSYSRSVIFDSPSSTATISSSSISASPQGVCKTFHIFGCVGSLYVLLPIRRYHVLISISCVPNHINKDIHNNFIEYQSLDGLTPIIANLE